MDGHAPVLSYATPRRGRRVRAQWPDAVVAIVQFAVAILLIAAVPAAVGYWSLQFSEGGWVAWLAWQWLGVGVAVVNLFAAGLSLWGTAFEAGGRRWRLGYVGATVVGCGLAIAAMLALERWPLKVTGNPNAPAVNDYTYAMSADDERLVLVCLVASNPMLFLLAVRWAGRPGVRFDDLI